MPPHLFGAHTRDEGGIPMAARRAGAAGMDCLQIFTAPPRFYGERATVKAERRDRFREALAEAGIRPDRVLVHGAYVLGVATEDPQKHARAKAGLRKELERTTTLGALGLCFHPGSAKDGTNAAAERVAAGVVEALEAVEGDSRVLLENTAGAGSTFGRTAAELGAVLERIPKALRPRTGYVLDTCHLFAAGHDISESEARLKEILDEFEEACGGPPSALHLNDSQGAMGSNKDRHALLGEGEIGKEAFRWLLADRRSRGIPLILETPHADTEMGEEDASADPNEERMIRLLRELAPG